MLCSVPDCLSGTGTNDMTYFQNSMMASKWTEVNVYLAFIKDI